MTRLQLGRTVPIRLTCLALRQPDAADHQRQSGAVVPFERFSEDGDRQYGRKDRHEVDKDPRARWSDQFNTSHEEDLREAGGKQRDIKDHEPALE